MSRYEVRVHQRFFDRLDIQLTEERGPNGEASRTDFLALDLPAIIETVATRFDELPLIDPEHTDFRITTTGATLVPAVTIVAQLADGIVYLTDVRIDYEAPWD